MRVFINCDLELGGGSGGAEQFVACLVHGLSELNTDHEFVLGVWPEHDAWLRPLLGERMRIAHFPVPMVPRRSPLEVRVRRALSPYKRKVKELLGSPAAAAPPPAPGATSAFVDGLGPRVCHFPTQKWVPTAAPSILNLHDLQHLHFPQFFGREQLDERMRWPAWAAGADLLAVHSEWTAGDFVEKLDVPESKVRVLPGASPLELVPPVSKEFVEETRTRLDLPDIFGLYPATTWPHKNHLALAEALSVVDGVQPTILCTGSKTDAWAEVEEALERLGLQARFRFLGFLSPQELKALYRLASFVIVPSLFEGGGSAAMYEALAEGVPLACSDIPSIPRAVRAAALLFDPNSKESMARAIREVVSDGSLRDRLLTAGRERAAEFSVAGAARGYLELYEELAARRPARELDRA